MTKDEQRINELERALIDVVSNLQEDIPEDEWTPELKGAVEDAIKLIIKRGI